MESVPTALRPASPTTPSTLERLVAATTSPQAQQALVAAVDWLAPDLRRSAAWDRGGGQMQCLLMPTHPLCAFIRPHGGKLFGQALAQAHAASTQNLRMELDRIHLNLPDWVGSSVLDTTCAWGSVEQAKALLALLGQRRAATRQPSATTPDGPNPWRAMAIERGSGRGIEDYQRVLGALDRYVREESLVAMPRGRLGAPGPAPARWTAMERRWRQSNHVQALELACRHGNAPMARAVLGMGHAQPTLEAIALAVEVGMTPLALEMAQGWRAPKHGARTGERMHLAEAVGAAARGWAHPLPQVADQADEHLVALDGLVAWAVAWARDVPQAPSLASGRGRADQELPGDIIGAMFPALLRAPQALVDAIVLPDAAGQTWACPTLAQWAALAQAPGCPWSQAVLGVVGALGPVEREKTLGVLHQDLQASLKRTPGGSGMHRDQVLAQASRRQERLAVDLAWSVLGDGAAAVGWMERAAAEIGLHADVLASARAGWMAAALESGAPGRAALRL